MKSHSTQRSISALPAVFVVLLCSIALAEAQPAGKLPSLEFHTLRVEEAGQAEHRLAPYRMYDKMTVTVWDPVGCGQTPVDPSFSIKDGRLYLRYALTPAAPGAGRCIVVSEFDVSNLPQRELEVHFSGGGPEAKVKLKPCPFASPAGGKPYDCLVPAEP